MVKFNLKHASLLLLILLVSSLVLSGCKTEEAELQNNEVEAQEVHSITGITPTPSKTPGFLVYDDEENALKLEYPYQWRQAKGVNSNIVMFSSPKASEEDSYAENINLAYNALGAEPLTALEYSEISSQAMSSVLLKYDLIKKSEEEFNGYSGYSLVYTASPDNIDLKFNQVGIIIEDKLYVFTYSAKPESYDQFYKEFTRMIKSFSVY